MVRSRWPADLAAVDVAAGEQLTVDVDTPDGGELLDSIVVLHDPDGDFVALNDDNIAVGELDSLLVLRALKLPR